MARVSWHILGLENEARQRSLPSPKRVTELTAWFMQCRLAIPQIPDPWDNRWQISHVIASIDFILFEMHSKITGQIGHVMVERNSNAIGF